MIDIADDMAIMIGLAAAIGLVILCVTLSGRLPTRIREGIEISMQAGLVLGVVALGLIAAVQLWADSRPVAALAFALFALAIPPVSIWLHRREKAG